MEEKKYNKLNQISKIIKNVAPFDNLIITNMVLLLAQYSLRAEIETKIYLIQRPSIKGWMGKDSKFLRSCRKLMTRT